MPGTRKLIPWLPKCQGIVDRCSGYKLLKMTPIYGIIHSLGLQGN